MGQGGAEGEGKGEEEDQDHGRYVLKCDHTQVVEHPGHQLLHVDVGDPPSLHLDLLNAVVGNVQVGLQVLGHQSQPEDEHENYDVEA